MSTTSPIQIENTTFLIERLAQDCSPLQYVRELTQNAFEAIQARRDNGHSGTGYVQWDVDWPLAQEYRIYKLQVSDNGKGMSGPEIEQYINRLSSSSGVQSFEQNFGIGAKITAGVENPAGLVYKSWQGGSGIMAQFWKDIDADRYGLKQFQIGEDFGHYRPIPDTLKPQVSPSQPGPIDDFGTTVTLLGRFNDDNTYFRPGLKQKWLIEYLNSRYFELPEEVVVQVRDFNNADPSMWPTSPRTPMGPGGSQMRTIVGMKELLGKNSESQGALKLSKAMAHWWILPMNLNVGGGVWNDKSHVAALFQSELYDIQRSQAARSTLQAFGIIYGGSRIVLYIEPDVTQLNVYSNTSRSKLLVAGNDLPWDVWASEFRANMPPAIKQMMDTIMADVDTGDYDDDVKRRLREIRDLYQIQRYRRTPDGPLLTDGEIPGGVSGVTETERGRRVTPGTRPNRGGAQSDLYGAFITEDGAPAERTRQQNNLPEIQFISLIKGTREVGVLEDRAAKYLPEMNIIQVNEDFRVFVTMMEVLRGQYPHAEAVDVKRSIQVWLTLQLTEVILGIQSLQGSPEWSDRTKLEAALSEEALTAAIMPRYAVFSQMKRQLGGRAGASSRTTSPESDPELDEDLLATDS